MTPQFGAAPTRRGRRRPDHRDPRRVHGACITQLLDGADACGSALIKVLTVNRQSLLPSALLDYVRRHEALSPPFPVTLPVESFGSGRCSQDALWPCRPPFVLSRTPPQGSRRRARWARRRTAMQWVNLQFATYSWLATGSAPPGQGVPPANFPFPRLRLSWLNGSCSAPLPSPAVGRLAGVAGAPRSEIVSCRRWVCTGSHPMALPSHSQSTTLASLTMPPWWTSGGLSTTPSWPVSSPPRMPLIGTPSTSLPSSPPPSARSHQAAGCLSWPGCGTCL